MAKLAARQTKGERDKRALTNAAQTMVECANEIRCGLSQDNDAGDVRIQTAAERLAATGRTVLRCVGGKQ